MNNVHRIFLHCTFNSFHLVNTYLNIYIHLFDNIANDDRDIPLQETKDVSPTKLWRRISMSVGSGAPLKRSPQPHDYSTNLKLRKVKAVACLRRREFSPGSGWLDLPLLFRPLLILDMFKD